MKNNRMYEWHAFGVAIGITMTFLMLAGGAVATTQVTTCNNGICFIEYSIPTTNSYPMGIAPGPNGNIWFTEFKGNKIGRLNISTGNITEYNVSTPNSGPENIILGIDGNLWFTEFNGNNISRLDASTGKIIEFTVPTSNSGPKGIAQDIYGNIWFTEFNGNNIGEFSFTPKGYEFFEYSIPTTNSRPNGITFLSPGSNPWFTEEFGNKIGLQPFCINLGDSSGCPPIEYPIGYAKGHAGGKGPASRPIGIASDGTNLWFTEFSGNNIGKITTDGTITEYAVTTASSGPVGITNNNILCGCLEFTEFNGNKLGFIDYSGSITDVPIPTVNSGPVGIAIDSNGLTWFTEASANKISGEIPFIS